MIMRAMHDPFLERFFSRIPREMAESFSDDQLLAVKQAFADQVGRAHSIDVRVSVPLLLRRYYVVFIAGPERRDRARRQRDKGARRLAKRTNIIFMIFLASVGLFSLLGVLYLVKSALGVNLLPDFSLGLWRQVAEQFGLMFR
jgi:hypothetical protein